jgi:hypothetical protein
MHKPQTTNVTFGSIIQKFIIRRLIHHSNSLLLDRKCLIYPDPSHTPAQMYYQAHAAHYSHVLRALPQVERNTAVAARETRLDYMVATC